ncbi:hypothetical protein F4779DRAFT_590319 [Xylariaceae sp. FL0662B]|nr:hypothetical protein F4779DRAFT_590319 [Xylariaceae sp. FL0662B]
MQSQSIRPVHILDLPNEILAQICTYVRGTSLSDGPLPLGIVDDRRGGVQDIKNIRLVCGKLYDASSRSLLPAVSVSMNLSSLARLDEISRHPLIAKGVQTVRVIIDFFAADLANDFDDLFLPYQYDQLEESSMLSHMIGTDSAFEWSGEDHLEAATKSNRILASWSKLLQNAPDSSLDDHDRESILLIQRAHKLYQHAYLEQEQILADGTFVKRVADAVARMPAAKFLFIADHDRSVLPKVVPLVKSMERPDLLINNIVQPMTWDHAQEQDIGTPPCELLRQIPLTIHRAGVMLADVNYQVAPVQDFYRLVGCDGDLNDLRAAMRQLRSFTFRPHIVRDFDIFDNEDEMRHLKDFVEAFTGTDSIRDIFINMDFLWWRGEVPPLSAGCLLLTRTWPRVRRVRFEGPLRFEELEEFYAKVKGRVDLILERVYLMSGSWADVLDIMHDNMLNGRGPGRGWSRIQYPRGAECDTMSEDHMTETFGDIFDSMANRYIRWTIRDNPLRDSERGQGWTLL